MVIDNALVVGPSHVVRIREMVESGALSKLFSPSNLIGIGGVPVWSKQLFELASAPQHSEKPIFMIVSDFRFGNTAFDRGGLPDELFADGFVGVSLGAITDRNDAILRDRCVKALQVWQDKFGDRIKFVFWDLLGRQVQDRLGGRHISNRQYNHPHWNLTEVQALMQPERIIDLAVLLGQPMDRVLRLVIDASNHPSQAGYVFIENIIARNLPVLDSFRNGILMVESHLENAARDLRSRYNHAVVLTGTSVWIDTLMRYLGPAGVREFEKLEVKLVPVQRQLGHPFRPAVIESESYCISINAGPSLAEDEGNRSVLWEPRCVQAISSRGEVPKFTYETGSTQAAPAQVSKDWVEIGPLGMPTLRGLIGLMNEL
jgi:hypothetical protein